MPGDGLSLMHGARRTDAFDDLHLIYGAAPASIKVN